MLNFSGKSLKIPVKEFLFRVWPTVYNFPKKTNSILFQGTISNIKKQNATYGMKWGDISNQIRQTLKLTNLWQIGNQVSRTFLLFDTRSKCESFYAITTHFKIRRHLGIDCLYRKQPSRGVPMRCSYKYAANLQENSHVEVWFQ